MTAQATERPVPGDGPQAGAALVVMKPGEVRLIRRPPVAAAAGQILVEPDLVGLCGTDLEIIDGSIDPAYIRYPVALGHEWTGVVAGHSPLAGRRVVVEGVIGCGHCARCAAGETNLCETYDEIGFTRDGAAASQIAVPAYLAHPVGPSVAAEDAVLTEPAAVVYRGLAKAGVAPGCRALVIGDGTIALLAVMLLRLWSPAEIAVVGRRGDQAELATAAGATSFGVTDAPNGYDLVVEAAGATAAVETALAKVRRGGTVLLLGLPPHGQTVAMAADDTVNNDLTILGSFSYTSVAWRAVVSLLDSGQLRPGILVTHRYRLAEWEQAITTLRGSPGQSGPRGKVLIQIDGSGTDRSREARR
ncbi:MAG TPA: alcohol dehydrogenase catalytic domain-containing protein [Streptosporangiaceae bacterium]